MTIKDTNDKLLVELQKLKRENLNLKSMLNNLIINQNNSESALLNNDYTFLNSNLPHNIDDFSFEDLFNINDIQKLQDEFSDALGIASIITKPDGTPITNPSNFTFLCKNIIRNTHIGLKNCYKSDAVIGKFSDEGPTVQACMSGGLWDAGAGIKVGGKHIANWLIGQVRDETQTEESMIAYAKEIGADEKDFITAFRNVPSMSLNQFKKIANVLYTLANQLSTSAYHNIKQAKLITKQKNSEELLRNESKFRLILIELASSFINLPLELANDEIMKALERMGRFVDADRAYTFDYDWNNNVCNNIFEWCADDIVPQIDILQNLPLDMMPDWVNAHKKGLPMFIADVFALPKGNARDVLEPQGIKSVLAVPMMIKGDCIGFVGFDFVRNHHNYSNSEQNLLMIFANLLVNIGQRIQAQDALESSEDRFKNLTDLLPLTVFETDTNGNLTFVNQMAFKQFNYTFEDFQNGINGFDMIIDKDKNRIKANFSNTLISDTPSSNEYTAIRKDGSTFPIMIFSNAITKNTIPIGIRGIVIDITNIKLAEEKINKLNEDLEHKVIERTAELNEAILIIEESNKELKALNKAIADEAQKLLSLNEKLAFSEQQLLISNSTKDKFFSIIAHDLRNPIGSMKNILEILKLYHTKMTSVEIENMINTLYEASDRTFDLLENLLYWARLQTNNINFTPELGAIFKNIDYSIKHIVSLADNKNIFIKINVSKAILAYYDPNYLNTIIRNLLTNAIKFTHSGGKVEIGVIVNTYYDIKSQNKDKVTIFVKDNGIGMSKETIDMLFRIDHNIKTIGTANEKGTGLGLILCKEFVEKQGGNIWVESEVGKGTTFYFTVPLYHI